MPRTPKRLHGPALVTNAAATKYTVPAITKTILRHIHAMNPSGSAVTLTLSIGPDGAAARIFDGYSIAAGQPFDHYPYYVLEAAEVIQALASTTNILVLTLNGDEYTLG